MRTSRPLAPHATCLLRFFPPLLLVMACSLGCARADSGDSVPGGTCIGEHCGPPLFTGSTTASDVTPDSLVAELAAARQLAGALAVCQTGELKQKAQDWVGNLKAAGMKDCPVWASVQSSVSDSTNAGTGCFDFPVFPHIAKSAQNLAAYVIPSDSSTREPKAILAAIYNAGLGPPLTSYAFTQVGVAVSEGWLALLLASGVSSCGSEAEINSFPGIAILT